MSSEWKVDGRNSTKSGAGDGAEKNEGLTRDAQSWDPSRVTRNQGEKRRPDPVTGDEGLTP